MPEKEREGSVVKLKIDKLAPPKMDIRKVMDEEKFIELMDSIRRLGILNPLIVRPLEDGRYEIIAGHRRYLAAKALGLEEVPCIIRAYGDLDTIIARIHENVIREDMNPADIAELVRRLRDESAYSYQEIGEFFGKGESWARTYYLIGGADPEILEALREGHITPSHAATLMEHPDREKRLYYLHILKESGGSVKALKMWIKQDMGLQESIRETQPVAKISDEKPYLRDIRGRCAVCWEEEVLDRMYRVQMCPECFSAFMRETKKLHTQEPRVLDHEIPEERRGSVE